MKNVKLASRVYFLLSVLFISFLVLTGSGYLFINSIKEGLNANTLVNMRIANELQELKHIYASQIPVHVVQKKSLGKEDETLRALKAKGQAVLQRTEALLGPEIRYEESYLSLIENSVHEVESMIDSLEGKISPATMIAEIDPLYAKIDSLNRIVSQVIETELAEAQRNAAELEEQMANVMSMLMVVTAILVLLFAALLRTIQQAGRIENTVYSDASEISSQLDRSSIYDEQLARMYNTELFTEFAWREVERNKREKKPLTLTMIEINNAQAYMDAATTKQFNHVLSIVMGIIFDHYRRPGDYMFRFGDARFAVLQADTGNESADKMAWKIVNAFGAKHVTDLSRTEKYLSLSIGFYSEVPWGTQTHEQWVDRATRSLHYAIKTPNVSVDSKPRDERYTFE